MNRLLELELLRPACARLMVLPRRVLQGLVHGYRLLLKPWLGNACRFEPTCSAYALQALEHHGAVRGTALIGWRVLRCNPWCEGGCDPVPPAGGGLFSRLMAPEASMAADATSSPVEPSSQSLSGAAPGASPAIHS